MTHSWHKPLRQLLPGLIIVLAGIACAAQDTPGLPDFGASFPVEKGTINLGNGALHIEIPITTYPQRGALPELSARLIYDSKFWVRQTDDNTGVTRWVPSGVPTNLQLSSAQQIVPGWRLVTGGEPGTPSDTIKLAIQCNKNGNNLLQSRYTKFAYQEANGTLHSFPIPQLVQPNINCGGGGGGTSGNASALASDASGFLMKVQNYAVSNVYAPDGTQVYPNLQDIHGNTITHSITHVSGGPFVEHVVDTLGREPVIQSAGTNQLYFDYLNPQGTRSRVTMNIDQPTAGLQTQFGQSGVQENSSGAGLALRSIVFPDGSTYSFQWDSYGMISSMTLPTGAQVSYGYTNFVDAQGNMSRWVTSHSVGAETWSFTPSQPSCSVTPCSLQVTLASPAYNDGTSTASDTRIYNFSVVAGTSGGDWLTQMQNFRGAATGNPVLSETFDYGHLDPNTGAITPGVFGAGTVKIRDTTFWSTTGGTLQKKCEYGYDKFSNLAFTKEWDYQPNGNFASTPDRETDNTFVTDPAYIGVNLLHLPKTTTFRDNLGRQIALTQMNYDETPPASTSNLSPAVPHHVAVSGPRGNLTTLSRWLNTTSSFLSTTKTYDDTGNLLTSTDPMLHQIQYSYIDNFSDGINRSTLAYLTSIKNPDTSSPVLAHHVTSTVYDFNTGVTTSAFDENSNRTDYSYDGMLRQVAVTPPADSSGNRGQTTTSFADPNTLIAQKKITPTLLDTLTSKLDNRGRLIQSIHATPAGNIIEDNTYDSLDRVATVSNPHLSAASTTDGTSSLFYDPLDRLVKTIGQDGSVSTISYNANCATYTDEVGAQRRVCHDAFGRVTEVDEPGDSSPGAPASGSISISGTLRSQAATNSVPGAGTVTISGSEQSKPSTPSAPGSVTVTISGFESSTVIDPCSDQEPPVGGPPPSCPRTIWDSGSVSATMNGSTESVPYGSTSTAATVASALAAAFNNDSASPVTAVASSASFTVTSKAAGAATNYSFSTSSSTNDFADFGGPSFAASPAAGSLSGGHDAGSPVFDTGTCSATVNGTTYNSAFGQGATSAGIASNLAAVISAGTVASAVSSNGAVTLTAKTTGTASNFPFSASCSFNSSAFTTASFTAGTSGTAFTGGSNGSPAAVDSGTVTLTVGPGFSVTACYGPSGACAAVTGCPAGDSTGAQVACVLGKGLNGTSSPVTPVVSGSSISLTYKAPGQAGNVALQATSAPVQPTVFPGGSFSGNSVLSNGADPYSSGLAHPYVTLYSYTYDAPANFQKCVEQHGNVSGTGCSASPSQDSTSPWRVRRQTINSLGEVAQTSSPEAGVITYGYDNDGAIISRTDGRGVTSNYVLDPMKRVLSKSFVVGGVTTQGPSFGYDQGLNGIGRGTSMSDSAGSSTNTYDALGRPTLFRRTTSGITRQISYSYNLDGSYGSITYPSNSVITYTLDANAGIATGRLISAIDVQHQINYVTSTSYGATGITGYINGVSNAFSGITNSFGYNNRLQPTSLQAFTSTQTLMNLSYDYHAQTADNGNVYGITNGKDATLNQTITYDSINRLRTAQTAGSDCTQKFPNGNWKFWGQQYTYDPWGSLLSEAITNCSGNQLSAVLNNKNQLIGAVYDGSGNMTTALSGATYTFDLEGRLSAAAGETFQYDASGNRIIKGSGSTGTIYWYGTPGVLAETDLAGNPKKEYVFFGGNRIAAKDSSGNVTYYLSDHLKSATVLANNSGGIVTDYGYMPWGEETRSSSPVDNHYEYTGKERDSLSVLDNFGARFYSSSLGRFISPDPSRAMDVNNPQSFNQYAYALDNPERNSDSSGKYPRDQHEFFTFAYALAAGRDDAQQLAQEASDADNFFNAAGFFSDIMPIQIGGFKMGIPNFFGLAMPLNYFDHFGTPPDKIGHTEEECGLLGCGGDAHLVEDNGNSTSPHSVGMWKHIWGDLTGRSPDRAEWASGGFLALGARLGVHAENNAVPDAVEKVRLYVNKEKLDIVGWEQMGVDKDGKSYRSRRGAQIPKNAKPKRILRGPGWAVYIYQLPPDPDYWAIVNATPMEQDWDQHWKDIHFTWGRDNCEVFEAGCSAGPGAPK